MSDESNEVNKEERAANKKTETVVQEKKAAVAVEHKDAAAGKVRKEEPIAEEKSPSVNQPLLDRITQVLKEQISGNCIEEAYINEIDNELPNIIISNEYWLNSAQILRDHNELKFDYLRNLSGVDLETHFEVVYHLYSFTSKSNCCIKVKADREHPSVPSVTPVWATANWNEREVFDLFGIDFPGHPDMRRIMMSDDWIGHPLRKDYEPADPEV